MFIGFKNIIVNLFKALGLYKPVRKIYNFLTLYNAKKNVALSGIEAIFFTPSYRIREDLEAFFGEREILECFLNEINDDDIVWDIGASYGVYSIFSALKLKGGKVFSFEPEMWTYKLLNKNIRLNNLKNIFPFQVALTNCEGESLIYKAESANIGTHSLVRRTDYPVSRKGKLVKTTTGDRLIKDLKLEYPNLIKIDVEGAELCVLDGMKNILLSSNLRVIQIELHPRVLPLFKHDEKMVIDYVQSFNFQTFIRKPRGTELEIIFKRG